MAKKKQSKQTLTQAGNIERGGASKLAQLNRRLASTEKQERDDALTQVVPFLLSNSAELGQLEMMILWKGLFYCFWMSDKPLVQQKLADELAEMLLELPVDLSSSFLSSFWATIVNEWHGIDQHRVDKFLLLLRRYVNASLRMLVKFEFSEASIKAYQVAMNEGPLNPNSSKVSDSIRYHIIDLFMTELEKVLPLTPELNYPISEVIQPITNMLAHTTNKVVIDKLKESVLSPLVEGFNLNPEIETSKVGAPALARYLFLLGADPKTLAKIRTICYEFVDVIGKRFDVNLTVQSEKSNGEVKVNEDEIDIRTETNSPDIPIIKSASKKANAEPSHIKKSKSKKQKVDTEKYDNLEHESLSQIDNEMGLFGFQEEDFVPESDLMDENDEDADIDAYSGFKVTLLEEVDIPKPDSKESISTHEVYVEELEDPVLSAVASGEGIPKEFKKKVRWVLERNQIKTFDKKEGIMITPRGSASEDHDISMESINSIKLKGLLKPSSLPILINKALIKPMDVTKSPPAKRQQPSRATNATKNKKYIHQQNKRAKSKSRRR